MRSGVAEIAPASPTDHTGTQAGGSLRVEERLRDSEMFLLVLALVAGIAAGVGVILIDLLLAVLRWLAFGIGPDGHLSDIDLGPARVLLMPVLGGLLVGLASVLVRRWRPREVVDAIEANALFGGRMSIGDSVGLVAATLLSGGFGASVGMEAAYTQLGAAMGSRLGPQLSLRRDDVRTLVGCGAAAAIAAAFNAPLAGAFYAFELVIGSYSPTVLAPISIAALSGTIVVRGVFAVESIFALDTPFHIAGLDYGLFAVLGVAAAGIAIATMRGVTWIEPLFRPLHVAGWLRARIRRGVL